MNETRALEYLRLALIEANLPRDPKKSVLYDGRTCLVALALLDRISPKYGIDNCNGIAGGKGNSAAQGLSIGQVEVRDQFLQMSVVFSELVSEIFCQMLSRDWANKRKLSEAFERVVLNLAPEVSKAAC